MISRASILFFVSLFFVLSSQNVFSQAAVKPETLDEIEKRAAEITASIPDHVTFFGTPVSDRVAWEKVAKYPRVLNVIRAAESLLDKPAPDAPKSLYREYYENGNRTNYQRVRGERYKRFPLFALAECVENKGRFLAPLEESIRLVCDDPSWLLPAHDRNGNVYDGKETYIDLTSALTSFQLALTDSWLGEKLSPEIRKRIRDEIERRTLTPYETAIRENRSNNWWITGSNNWNAVCHAGVIGAALAMIEEKERRAFFIASAECNVQAFLNGFSADGYCSEGIGYWNYGFGNFLLLAETICQGTQGQVDLFKSAIVRDVTLFGPKMEVAPGLYGAFADCSPNAKPSTAILAFMNRRLELGLPQYNKIDPRNSLGTSSLDDFGCYAFENSADSHPLAAEPQEKIGLRSDFSIAGITICRAAGNDPNRLAVVFKGGHNAEEHNHNDVGSYTLMLGGATPLFDPGAEVYTARTFSGKRYDSNVLNSFGHPVPRINGQLQQNGRKAEGIVLEKNFTDEIDTVLFGTRSAYADKTLRTLTRLFQFDRTDNVVPGGLVTIIDAVEFSQPGMFETALITDSPFENLTKTSESDTFEFRIGPAANQRIRVLVTGKDIRKDKMAAQKLKFEATEIKEDLGGRKNPWRLAFSWAEPSAEGAVSFQIQRAE